MMDRFTGLEVLVAIVDSGGFSRAAGRLNMSPAMVSTHLARLEERLGAKLIERTTRRLDLTPQGRHFVDEARTILATLVQAETAVRRGRGGPGGRVQLDAPGAVGLRFVVPALPALRALHPEIVLDLSVGDRGTVFRTDGFDLLVRVGQPNEGRGHAVPLGETRFVQVASPAYLARRGVPETPDALLDHDLVTYATAASPIGHRWRFWKDGEMHWLRPPGVATFNHGDAIARAVEAGVGIGQTLEMLVVPEIAEGRLVPVLTEWNRNTVPIQLVMPEDRATRPAVKAVADFLRDAVDWSGHR
jgi:LysR family transcriptional regulator, regulator for bpeEF and oprC